MLAADTWSKSAPPLIQLAAEAPATTGELLEPSAYASALRLGLILSGQMSGFIAWVKSKDFTPLTLHEVPEDVEMQNEITDEFVRIFIGSYVDGVFSTARPGYIPVAALDDEALLRWEIQAANLADAVVHAIRTEIMPVLESTWTPSGERTKDDATLEREIRSVYVRYLQRAPRADLDLVMTLAESNPVDRLRDEIVEEAQQRVKKRRRMKVRDQKQRDKFLRDHKPFSKWIQQSVEQIRAEAKAPPTISPKYAIRWVQTERTRMMIEGVIEATQDDPDVIGYRFSAHHSTKSHHPACAAMNGKIISKADRARMQIWKGPLHHGCHSRFLPVYRWEHEKPTPVRQLPSPSLIAPGFGGVYAERGRTHSLQVEGRFS